eukprot:10778080-Ditylum_brightwellii.AAC.1
MLGCNVDVFGITSKLKEHIDLIQLRKRRVFWSASSVITPLLGDQSCWANDAYTTRIDGRASQRMGYA